MRRLLLTLPFLAIFIAPSAAIALTGPATRFDNSFLYNGRLVADATTNCNNQATARFDWSLGQPAVIYDATATCTAAGGGGATSIIEPGVYWFE